MILVTVGTEQYPFNALLDWVDALIRYRFIEQDEEIIVQYGASTRLPDRVKIYQRLPESEFRNLVAEARLIIAHCGEGSALLLESSGKPYVLVPRTQKFGEHVDDHQLEMADAMEKRGISVARSPGDLVRFLAEPKVPSATLQLQDELCCALDRCYNPRDYRKLMLVCSSGGHFKAMQELKGFWEKFTEISWVTFRTASTESELKSRQDQAYWAYSPTNRNIPNLIRNLGLAFSVLDKDRPDLIVSTGAGVAVPFLLIAKFFYGSEVVFVESKTRLQKLSLSARILQTLSALDQLIVQSEDLARQCPDALWIDTGSSPIPASDRVSPPTAMTQFKDAGFLSTPVRLDASEADGITQSVQALCKSYPKTIVLDMSATRLIDSAGLRALYTSLELSKAVGCELVLWSVAPSVMTVLSKARFDRLFKIEAATAAVRTQKRSYPPKPLKLPGVLPPNPFRRTVEIVAAILGLFAAALLLVPIAIAVWLESPGPIFTSYTRCGRLGKRFRFWKFRTTVSNPASFDVDDCLDGACPQGLTRVGRFLQHTRLDGLPIWLNVLNGDVNLAGLFTRKGEEPDLTLRSQRCLIDVKSANSCGLASGMKEFEDTIRLSPNTTEI